MAAQPKTIIILTLSYPYTGGREQTFLQDEIQITGQYFERVILVPQRLDGALLKIPKHVNLDESLAQTLNNIGVLTMLKALFSPLFYNEIAKLPYTLKHLRMITGAYARAVLTKEWLVKYLRKNYLSEGSVIFYSFWMDSSTIGALFAKIKYPQLKVVSRCHNADLYGNEDNFYHVAFQKFAVPMLDMNFPDSEAGTCFIKENFHGAKCETAIMGIRDPGFTTKSSSDGIFRIVSCSYMIPRKRVGIFLDGLTLASKMMPERKLLWYHIGDGPLQEQILRKAKIQLPSNCRFKFLGSLSPEKLMVFYKENAVDLFVNTSVKEGTPLSLIEAIGCGIPLLATSICGNKEILDYGTGFPLKENPTKEEIAESLINIIAQDRDRILRIRENCREIWKSYYNSEHNYNIFFKKLQHLLA